MARPAELPCPFLRWPGGKARLADEVLDVLAQRRVRTYFEPFLGGGAVFFRGIQRRAFDRAVLGDVHGDVVNAYRVVRDELDALLVHLRRRARRAEEHHYYRVRDADVSRWSAVERAARFLFLNRTAFNGLQRVNASGRCNVPWGRRAPRFDEEVLEAASRALQGVELVHGDFESTLGVARAGDAVYLDPPYVPTSATSSFVGYAAGGFGIGDHVRLAAVVRACRRRGVACVVSSSDTSTARHLLEDAGLAVRGVRMVRSIAARGGSRGPVRELLGVG